ncbi:MAG: DUF5758 domain-containing protein [Mogibacterium sp.]|nr:DUF5758 domain-containing protein [Mogibacterium sp.]
MELNASERDFYEETMSFHPNPDPRVIESEDELKADLTKRDALENAEQNKSAAGYCEDGKYDLREVKFRNMDLHGWDLSDLDLYKATFENCNLNAAVMNNCKADHLAFYDCDIRGLRLTNSMARAVSYRYHDMEGIDISGTNIYASVLEDAHNQDKVIHDDRTRWYKMSCPEEGPFIAWKCCTELRVVQMLIPSDAKRCMSTLETGRTSKAKVLSIKSIDETVEYDWAQSTVDPDFYYEKGQWMEPANGFQEDRWKDSSPGIHFFLDRQQCVDYQSK